MTIGIFYLVMDSLFWAIVGGLLISAVFTVLAFIIVKCICRNSDYTPTSYITGGILMIVLSIQIIQIFIAHKIKGLIESGIDFGQSILNSFMPVIGEYLQVDKYLKSAILDVDAVDSYVTTRIIICIVIGIIAAFIIGITMKRNGSNRRSYRNSYDDFSGGYGSSSSSGGIDSF